MSLRSFAFFALLCVALHTVRGFASSPPSLRDPVAPPCAFGAFDFTSLRDRPDDFSANTTQVDAYYLHVCGSLTSPPADVCSSITWAASACLTVDGSGYVLGEYVNNDTVPALPAVWSYIDPHNPAEGGVQYTQQGTVCFQGERWTSTVQFLCGENSQDDDMGVTTDGACGFTMTIHTPFACAAAARRRDDDHEDSIAHEEERP